MVFLRSVRSLAFCSIHDFALHSSDMIDCIDPAIMNFLFVYLALQNDVWSTVKPRSDLSFYVHPLVFRVLGLCLITRSW